MISKSLKSYQINTVVARALKAGLPVVALESTVITHGLPYPQNRQIAEEMESIIAVEQALPATIAVLDGKIRVGLNSESLNRLASEQGMKKISLRDFGYAKAKNSSGGTTVAGTIFVAHHLGIRVFATGGIGGVHRTIKHDKYGQFDISADLYALAKFPVIVVCAGAKGILDLAATMEILETIGVPVVGYQTDEFPAFFCQTSGIKTSMRADAPQEVYAIAEAHWSLGFKTAVLVVVPPPTEMALPAEEMEKIIEKAILDAEKRNIHGQDVTPFLLERVNQMTGGKSLEANLALLRNNAKVAAQIARIVDRGCWQEA